MLAQQESSPYIEKGTLALSLIFLFIFAFLSFDGYYFYDDITYAHYAFQLQKGTFSLNDKEIFAHRLGLIVPLAGLYALFGVSDLSTLLLPFLSTVLSSLLVYGFLRRALPQAALYGFLLSLFDFYALFFSNKLYTDVLLVPLSLGAALLLFYRKNNWRWAFGFALLNFYALLTKEMIIYFLPFYGFVLFDDLRRGRLKVFWGMALGAGVLLLGLYLYMYYFFTGNALYRYSQIEDGSYPSALSYYDKPWPVMLARLSYLPLLMFIGSNQVIAMLGGGMGFLSGKVWKNRESSVFFWHLLALLALGMFYYLSGSFKYYHPMGLLGRFVLFLVPVFAIASAYGSQLLPRFRLYSALAYVGIAGLCYGLVDKKMSLLYGLLALVYGMGYLIQSRPRLERWFMPALALVLALHPAYTMLKGTETGYGAEKKIVETYLLHPSSPTVVFTDNKLLSGHAWYYRFRVPPGIRYLDFGDMPRYAQAEARRYVLLNAYSLGYLGLEAASWIAKPPPGWTLRAHEGQVYLYEIK